MKKNGVVLKIHSMVDVITNSSSVTYVTAGSGSITKVKELVNNLLTFSDSDKKADDLFDFKLEPDEDEVKDARMNELKNEYDGDWKELKEIYEEIEKGEREIPEWWDTCFENKEYSNTYIRVRAKVNDKNVEQCAKILSNLNNLFDYESSYDG